MKLFVTGGTGFVGGHFLAQAQAAGHDITALRRAGSRPRMPLSAPVRWIDSALDGDLQGCFDGIDAVVHFAAHTANPPYAPLSECLYWNVFATARLCEQAASVGVQNFVIAGTCFEYGDVDSSIDRLHPGLATRPRLSYPVSKAAATEALCGLARDKRLRLQVLRVFQVFGEGEAETRLWPALRAAARAGRDFPMSPGEQIRDFIPVEDVATAFLSALTATVEPGQPVIRNVGSGKPQTVRAFCEHWWQHWGATGQLMLGATPMRSGEVMRIVADVEHIHRP